MGIGGWALLALTGILVFVLLLLVAPVRLRVLWGELEKSFSIRYMGLSVEFDYACRCRRIRLLNGIIAASPWPVTSKAAPRSGRGKSHHATPGGGVGGPARIRRFAARIHLLWSFRVTLRRAFLTILRFLGRVVRAWQVERAEVRMMAGLGDPARTGMATGWFYSAWSVLRHQFPRLQIYWDPCFDRRVLRVHAEIVLRIRPVEVVYHATRALAALPWRGLWKLRSALAK